MFYHPHAFQWEPRLSLPLFCITMSSGLCCICQSRGWQVVWQAHHMIWVPWQGNIPLGAASSFFHTIALCHLGRTAHEFAGLTLPNPLFILTSCLATSFNQLALDVRELAQDFLEKDVNNISFLLSWNRQPRHAFCRHSDGLIHSSLVNMCDYNLVR